MIDTHCHLWFENFTGEVPQVIERAKSAGVHTLICVGCDEKSSRQSVELAGQYENVYAAVGIHPTEVKLSEQTLRLTAFAQGRNDKIIAIGETGLDYYHSPESRDTQIKAFREQCEIAKEHDLPVIVHLRSTKESKAFSKDLTQAEQDCLHVLDSVGSKKVLFHCFSGDRTMAEEVLKRGYYLSFSGVLTFPKAEELREVVKICPLDRMVVETDSPFLAPLKYRGKRNEPSFVVEVGKLIAELKAKPYDEMENILDENTKLLFFATSPL